MKVLFWIFAVLSLAAGLFMSFVCFLTVGLGLIGTGFGAVLCFVGMLSVLVSLVFVILGIIKYVKKNVKTAVVFSLIGIAFSLLMFAGILIDELADTIQHNKRLEERGEQYTEYGDESTPIDVVYE